MKLLFALVLIASIASADTKGSWFSHIQVPEILGGQGETISEAFSAVNHFFTVLFTGSSEPQRRRMNPAEVAAKKRLAREEEERLSASEEEFLTGCEPGIVIATPSSVDTCTAPGKDCTVYQAFCNGTEASLYMTAAELLARGAECTVTKMICDGITVDLEAQHGATNCVASEVMCPLSTWIGLCSLQVVCDPGFVTFGKQAYGKSIVTGTIDCNGTRVQDPFVYDNETLPAGCVIGEASVSNTNATCYDVSCSNETTPCTVSVGSSPCSDQCRRVINTTRCLCPVDRTGSTCKDKSAVTCTAVLVTPVASCPNDSSDALEPLVDYDRECFTFGPKTDRIGIEFKLSCRSDLATLSGIIPGDPFTYWVSTSTLKLSDDPMWSVRAKVFNFDDLSDSTVLATAPVTHDNLAGNATITLTVPFGTLKQPFRHGGRVYLEVGFVSGASPSGQPSNVLRRMTFDFPHDTTYPRSGLGGGAIAGIVIGSVAGVAIIVAIVLTIIIIRKPKKQPK